VRGRPCPEPTRLSGGVAMKRNVSWVDVDGRIWKYEFHDYMRVVAQARHVFRAVQRIIDECAKGHGIEPLEHQAMIQIYGAAESKLPIGQLAKRLNIVPALASRLVQQLEDRGFARRIRSTTDRRATYVSLTSKGVSILLSIVEVAHDEVGYFRARSSEEQRRATHEVTAFYIGSLHRKTSNERPAAGRTSRKRAKAR